MHRTQSEVRIPAEGQNSNFRLSFAGSDTPMGSDFEITNLSRNGMFVKSDNLPSEGSSVDFSIEGDRGSPRIEGRAQVCWQRTASQSSLHPKGFGLNVFEFDEISKANWYRMLETRLGKLTMLDLVSQNFLTCPRHTPIKDVVASMRKSKHKVALIVDPKKKPLGIVGSNELIDIIADELDGGETVDAILKREPLYLNASDQTEKAIELILEHDVDYLPILQQDQLIGIVSTKAILRIWKEINDLNTNRIKQNFVKTMGVLVHDMNNPLGVIKTASAMLNSKMIEPAEYVEQGISCMVEENCDGVIRLVDELLKVTKEDYHSAKLELRRVDLVAILRKAFRNFQYQAQIKNIFYHLDIETSNVFILADNHKIMQILNNLISNALKYSDANDTVKVAIRSENNKAQITIADTGQGISAKEIDKVFDEFANIASKTTKGETSTGLGLSITRKLVLAQKGSIKITSDLGKGSIFTLLFPLHQSS